MTPNEYQQQAMRTKSDLYRPSGKIGKALEVMIADIKFAGCAAKMAKKAIFYGTEVITDNPKPWFTNVLPPDVLHGVLGVVDETAEIVEEVKDSLFNEGTPPDYIKLDAEFGDLLWFIACYCNGRGITMDDLMKQNIAKLQTRYPEKFTAERANNRDLDAEDKAAREAR